MKKLKSFVVNQVGILLIYIGVGFVAATSAKAVTLGEFLKPFGHQHGEFNNEVLDKEFHSASEAQARHEASFVVKGIQYRLEVRPGISKKKFTELRTNISSVARKNYTEEVVPYQGELTSTSVCPKKFHPVASQVKVKTQGKTKDISILKHFSGANYARRICDDKLIAYSQCTSFYRDAKGSHYYKLIVLASPKEDCSVAVTHFFEKLIETEVTHAQAFCCSKKNS